jgi:GT2 family glycosyltransferase
MPKTSRPGRVPPSVLVLVLNYNGGAPLDTCLASLQSTTYPNARVVALDNGSTDGSLEFARRRGIPIQAYGENLGYCGAYNRAFREFAGQADFFVLSNADLVVPPETIGRMVAAAERDESIGFVGPLQRHEDSRDVRSAGIRWRCGHLPMHLRMPEGPIDAVEGAFVLVRPSVIDRVGGLDEILFLNLEDVEWQTRARHAGFGVTLATGAEILHRRPGSTRRMTGAYYQTRNACILTSRFCRGEALLRLQIRLYVEGIAGSILFRPRAPYVLEGLRDFRRGVTGMRRFSYEE